jgi:uncharacterized membrane protein
MLTFSFTVIAIYLIIGIAFAFKGRLAFGVKLQTALLENAHTVPQWKKTIFTIYLTNQGT